MFIQKYKLSTNQQRKASVASRSLSVNIEIPELFIFHYQELQFKATSEFWCCLSQETTTDRLYVSLRGTTYNINEHFSILLIDFR